MMYQCSINYTKEFLVKIRLERYPNRTIHIINMMYSSICPIELDFELKINLHLIDKHIQCSICSYPNRSSHYP